MKSLLALLITAFGPYYLTPEKIEQIKIQQHAKLEIIKLLEQSKVTDSQSGPKIRSRL